MLQPVSRTFHGRDVFAPAAAHLALGTRVEELGPSVAASELQRVALPEPDVAPFWVGARVLYADRFGNLQLNATRDDLDGAGIDAGAELELEVGTARHPAVAGLTFADVPPGGIVVYEDAYGRAAIAINGGNAAERLRTGPGQLIRISCR
jgi:S-adenosylmethionine hydrolase